MVWVYQFVCLFWIGLKIVFRETHTRRTQKQTETSVCLRFHLRKTKTNRRQQRALQTQNFQLQANTNITLTTYSTLQNDNASRTAPSATELSLSALQRLLVTSSSTSKTLDLWKNEAGNVANYISAYLVVLSQYICNLNKLVIYEIRKKPT